MPGAKQIFRDEARDVIARSGECGRGEALLRPVILRRPPGGAVAHPGAGPQPRGRIGGEACRRALRQLEVAEPWPVIYSRELRDLIERTHRNLMG